MRSKVYPMPSRPDRTGRASHGTELRQDRLVTAKTQVSALWNRLPAIFVALVCLVASGCGSGGRDHGQVSLDRQLKRAYVAGRIVAP